MAKKPSITTVASGYQSTTTINDNTQNLRNAFDNTLSLDGSSPNAMQADLDMNSNDILNVKSISADELIIDNLNLSTVVEDTAAYATSAAASATSATASSTAAAASYDSFDDRYLGAKATAPTLDNDGNALLTGALYWNTTSSQMFVRSSSAWINYEATSVAAAATATTQASTATAQAAIATTQAGLASTARTGAETARDAAFGNANVYASTAAGLAATTNGQQFQVVVGSDIVRYQNTSGTAVEVARYPNTAAIQAITDIIDEEFAFGDYAYIVRDEAGYVSLGVKNDGTVVADTVEAETFRGQLEVFPVVENNGVTPVLTINDPVGRTAFEVQPDGSVSVASLSSPMINGGYAQSSLRANIGSGTYDTEITYFTNTGQSLATGRTPAVTRTQEYDNVGFAARSTSPTSFLSLTAANCSQGGDAEPPMFGAMGSIKELVQRENGLSYTDQLYKLVATDNSNGSWAIAALSKGTQWYNTALSQATSAKSLAIAEYKTFLVGGVFWTQGEADSGNGYSYYLNAIKTLATDYNTDFKAITGQTKDIHFITYQLGSTTANKHVALAQLQASIDSSLIHLACPMYQFDYDGDGVHITADSSKWLGGYYGLVYKRVAVDGVVWTPTRPMSSVVSGNFVNVKFHLMVKPLVIDTVLIPAQTNYGFTLVDSSNNPLTISSVAVSGPDTVKIVASATIPAGAKLRYGFNTAVNKGGGYVSGCGNLRDSQGQIVTYYSRPLHNWSVFFELSL